MTERMPQAHVEIEVDVHVDMAVNVITFVIPCDTEMVIDTLHGGTSTSDYVLLFLRKAMFQRLKQMELERGVSFEGYQFMVMVIDERPNGETPDFLVP